MVDAKPRLLNDDLLRAFELSQESDGIELKLTVPSASHRGTLQALDLDPLDAQIRQVFFLDTPDLRLNQVGLVLRARRVQGRDHDSVVKLRPVVPSELPAKLRESPNFVVEVDAMPGSFVCSASMKATLDQTIVREATQGRRRLSKLFTKEQRGFFAEHAPEGTAIDDLSVLGPIFVLKLKVQPKTFDRKVVVEMWLYPDGSRVLELSTKCIPGEAMGVVSHLRGVFSDLGIPVGGDQHTKTATALSFFAGELRAAGRS